MESLPKIQRECTRDSFLDENDFFEKMTRGEVQWKPNVAINVETYHQIFKASLHLKAYRLLF